MYPASCCRFGCKLFPSDLNVKYFKPLKEGDEIIAKAKVVHHGKTLSSVVAHVFKKIKPEVEVAMASATFNIYKVSN